MANWISACRGITSAFTLTTGWGFLWRKAHLQLNRFAAGQAQAQRPGPSSFGLLVGLDRHGPR
jgi:hypothetical protein